MTVVNDLGAGSYSQNRWAFRGGSKASENNESGDWKDPNCVSASGFNKCTQIPPSSDPPLDPNKAIILRIRPFWNKTTVRVFSVNEQLPVQTYELTSQATTEIGVTRKVQVTRTVLPQLPAAFDYVLYSEERIFK